jgi:hypothetical protein
MTQSDDETGRKAVIGFAWEMRTPLTSLQGHAMLLVHYLEALKMHEIPSIKVEALGNVELSVEDALEMLQSIEQTIQGLYILMNQVFDGQS